MTYKEEAVAVQELVDKGQSQICIAETLGMSLGRVELHIDWAKKLDDRGLKAENLDDKGGLAALREALANKMEDINLKKARK